jgi:hypothetical protein
MKNELTVKLAMQLVVITITVMAVFIGARLWINSYELNQEIEKTPIWSPSKCTAILAIFSWVKLD